MPPRAGARSKRDFLVLVTDALGRRSARWSWLGRWLQRAAPARTRGMLAIAIVSDPVMRRLNREFRSKNTVTDVLSFPAEPHRPVAPMGRRITGQYPKASKFNHLGDLAIASGRAARQAREQGHSLRTEVKVLALHGLLHLLGYDHERDRGEMRDVESRLRRRAKLPLGLIARAAARSASR